MTDNKFPEELRTFETRLLFLKSLYDNLFEPVDIMAHCIMHKLDRSYLMYNDVLKESTLNLTGKDPLSVLRKLK